MVTASRLLPGARADALVISPDGAYVVSTGDGYSIKVWDLASARLLHEVRDSGRAADSKAPNAVAVSPGSRYFATAHEGGAIHVWEIATARKLLTWKAHPESCRFLGFSADGRKLISAGPDAIATWEIENARELYRAKVPAALGRVAMSGDGAKLLVHFGDDWEPDFRIFDAATGRELAQMELRFDQAAPIDALSAMALSADGKLALLGAINELYLVDTDSGRPVRKIASHGMVECAALTADGRRILVGTSAQTPNDEELEKADSPEWDAIFKRLLSAPLANKVHVWDAASGSELVRFDGHPEAVKALAVSVDGKRVVSSGGDGFARIWDLGI